MCEWRDFSNSTKKRGSFPGNKNSAYEYFRSRIKILNNLGEIGAEIQAAEREREKKKQPWLVCTVIEVALLVHHERLDFRAVVPAEGEGPGVLRSELVLPGASEVDGVH